MSEVPGNVLCAGKLYNDLNIGELSGKEIVNFKQHMQMCTYAKYTKTSTHIISCSPEHLLLTKIM